MRARHVGHGQRRHDKALNRAVMMFSRDASTYILDSLPSAGCRFGYVPIGEKMGKIGGPA